MFNLSNELKAFMASVESHNKHIGLKLNKDFQTRKLSQLLCVLLRSDAQENLFNMTLVLHFTYLFCGFLGSHVSNLQYLF